MNVSHLEVGATYKLFSGDLMELVHERQNRFLGVIIKGFADNPSPMWYTADGKIYRDADVDEQDPWDIKALHREPRTIFLLEKDDKLVNNNAIYDREAAAALALEKGFRLIPFVEVME